jgi:hypothetical protein
MTGAKGRGQKGQRPEFEQKYGYDVRTAMLTLRLLHECKESVSEAILGYPVPSVTF